MHVHIFFFIIPADIMVEHREGGNQWHKEWASRVVKLEILVGVAKMCLCIWVCVHVNIFRANVTQNISMQGDKHKKEHKGVVWQSMTNKCICNLISLIPYI